MGITINDVPLFPLGTVLFPEGKLPLRIFEPRYLGMVSRCLKQESPFGVCLIQDGKEVGQQALPFNIGTLANIVDWHRLPDEFLGIVGEGGARFRINETEMQRDNLLTGSVFLIPEEPRIDVPSTHQHLVTILKGIYQENSSLISPEVTHYEDANWVSYRLAEHLPVENEFKQKLLEITGAADRLDIIERVVGALTK